MADFVLSAASRRNIFELQSIDRQIRTAENRIATGLRVRSPADNPSAFYEASALRRRSSDLSRVLDDINSKLQTLEAADAAIGAIISLVQTAQSDLNSALASAEPQPTATGDIIVSDQTNVTDLAGVADSDQFSVEVGSAGATTITITNSDTPTTLFNKLNAIADVSASYTTEGHLQISTTNGEDLTLTEVTNTPLAGLGITAGVFDQTSVTNSLRSTIASDFDSLRTQIDQLAGDASYNGVNLLSGDSLTLTFNESGSASLTIAGVTFTSSGLGIAAASNNLQLDADINAAKADLKDALDTLRGFSSRLATHLSVAETRRDFTSDAVSLLDEGASNLTVADVNEESATLLALQTRKELASAAFSLLQDSESSILRLF